MNGQLHSDQLKFHSFLQVYSDIILVTAIQPEGVKGMTNWQAVHPSRKDAISLCNAHGANAFFAASF